MEPEPWGPYQQVLGLRHGHNQGAWHVREHTLPATSSSSNGYKGDLQGRPSAINSNSSKQRRSRSHATTTATAGVTPVTSVSHPLTNETWWRIYQAAAFIQKQLLCAVEQDGVELLEFMHHTLSSCYIVMMTARDEAASFRIFSTLNGRGMDLSVVDKLKSDLLQVGGGGVREGQKGRGGGGLCLMGSGKKGRLGKGRDKGGFQIGRERGKGGGEGEGEGKRRGQNEEECGGYGLWEREMRAREGKGPMEAEEAGDEWQSEAQGGGRRGGCKDSGNVRCEGFGKGGGGRRQWQLEGRGAWARRNQGKRVPIGGGRLAGEGDLGWGEGWQWRSRAVGKRESGWEGEWQLKGSGQGRRVVIGGRGVENKGAGGGFELLWRRG